MIETDEERTARLLSLIRRARDAAKEDAHQAIEQGAQSPWGDGVLPQTMVEVLDALGLAHDHPSGGDLWNIYFSAFKSEINEKAPARSEDAP
jgi:hypothetical protein